jgi:type III secretion protein HrpB1
MDSKLTSKEVFSVAIDSLILGVQHDRIADAESVLACLRVMRPRIAELDALEAWILIKRGHFQDAGRLLSNIQDIPNASLQVRALLAYCQFMTNDSQWSVNAEQIVQQDEDPYATKMMSMLLEPEATFAKYAAEIEAEQRGNDEQAATEEPTSVEHACAVSRGTSPELHSQSGRVQIIRA